MNNNTANYIEKLEDVSLESISGGVDPNGDTPVEVIAPAPVSTGGNSKEATACTPVVEGVCGVNSAAITATTIGAIGAVGCSIAAAVCKVVSVKAMRRGDLAKSATYQKAAVGLGACVAPFAVAGIVGGFATGKSCSGAAGV